MKEALNPTIPDDNPSPCAVLVLGLAVVKFPRKLVRNVHIYVYLQSSQCLQYEYSSHHFLILHKTAVGLLLLGMISKVLHRKKYIFCIYK
jgi:hypothetical protein